MLTANSVLGNLPLFARPSYTHSRVRPRATLHADKVLVQNPATNKPWDRETLQHELLSNHALRGVELVDAPHFSCNPDKLDSLEFCPVQFTFIDPDGSVRAKLLSNHHVWLFGEHKSLRVPPVRPAFAQCEKCQALGHTKTGCKAQPVCAHCAGRHLTSKHRSLCPECASAALPKETPCPHPHTCANCKEAHMATDASCPRHKKYARPPSPDAPVTQGPNDDQVPMAEDGN